jgi:hypothetical protein
MSNFELYNMSSYNVVPAKDRHFDIFQEKLVTVVKTNFSLWGIEQTDLDNLLTAQKNWENIWSKTKKKKKRSNSERLEKELARNQYEAVLNPFIHKWIFRSNGNGISHNTIRNNQLNRKENNTPYIPIIL